MYLKAKINNTTYNFLSEIHIYFLCRIKSDAKINIIDKSKFI